MEISGLKVDNEWIFVLRHTFLLFWYSVSNVSDILYEYLKVPIVFHCGIFSLTIMQIENKTVDQ